MPKSNKNLTHLKVPTMFKLWQHGLLSIYWCTFSNQQSFGQVFLIKCLKHIFTCMEMETKIKYKLKSYILLASLHFRFVTQVLLITCWSEQYSLHNSEEKHLDNLFFLYFNYFLNIFCKIFTSFFFFFLPRNMGCLVISHQISCKSH